MRTTLIHLSLLAFCLCLFTRPAPLAAASPSDGAPMLSAGSNTASELKNDDKVKEPKDKKKKSKKNDGKDGDPDDGNAGGGNDDKKLPNDGPLAD